MTERSLPVAWAMFTLYYVFVHSLPPLSAWVRRSRMQVGAAVSLAILSSLFIHGDMFVNDTMQKVVIAHVVIDEMNR